VAIETLMTGGDINPAQVLTAIQKADMSFRMMQQIRNKLMDAYREIKEIRI
jgi:flagellar hook-basal body complex protein FliE